MSDPIPTPPEAIPPDTHEQPPGFFNQVQLNDIKQGEDLHARAAFHLPADRTFVG